MNATIGRVANQPWATAEMRRRRADSRRETTRNALLRGLVSLLKADPTSETFTWDALSEASGVAKSTISRHKNDPTDPFDIRASVRNLKEVVLRQDRLDFWTGDEASTLPLRDPEFLHRIAATALALEADPSWSADEQEGISSARASQYLNLTEAAVRIATLYAEPEERETLAPSALRWISDALRVKRESVHAGSHGIAVRFVGYRAFLEGAAGMPPPSHPEGDWQPLLDPFDDLGATLRVSYLLGAANAGRADVVDSSSELVQDLDPRHREQLVAELAAASWIYEGATGVRCRNLAKSLALSIDTDGVSAGSEQDLTRMWRAWATDDTKGLVDAALGYLDVEAGSFNRSIIVDGEYAYVLAIEGLRKLRREEEVRLIEHAAQIWVDSRRTDFMAAGVRRRIVRIAGRPKSSVDSTVPPELADDIRSVMLQLRLARAVGMTLPADIRSRAVDLLQLITTTPSSKAH
jgi:hypothetical protein